MGKSKHFSLFSCHLFTCTISCNSFLLIALNGISGAWWREKTLETWVTILLITEAGCACRASCACAPPSWDKGKQLKNTLQLEEVSLAGCTTVWPWHAAWPHFCTCSSIIPTTSSFSFIVIKAFHIAIGTTMMFQQQKTSVINNLRASQGNAEQWDPLTFLCITSMFSSAEVTDRKWADSNTSLPVLVILQFCNDDHKSILPRLSLLPCPQFRISSVS